MVLHISNRDARRLWLHATGLAALPIGPVDVPATIRQLGFVQLDSIRYLARAHDHILWSRNQNYRPHMLHTALAEARTVFEHFTHDAAILPMETYPMWQRQYIRLERKVRNWEWHRGMLDDQGRRALKARIAAEGPLSTRAFSSSPRSGEMWSRPPHKLALDYMWYAGELGTAHRENFVKFYDLQERIIPELVRGHSISDADQIDWLCRAALQRLGFATPGDIMRFWNAADLQEVKTWVAANTGDLIDVSIEGADGRCVTAIATADLEARLSALPPPTSRLRILNPFDPALRDRKRLAHLFGYAFRIEIFVPATKRQWGYYVCPLLEGDRLLGRIEVKAERASACLNVIKVWPEPKIRWTNTRQHKLQGELARLARFTGCDQVTWTDGAQAEPSSPY